jgi:hypothetical protein
LAVPAMMVFSAALDGAAANANRTPDNKSASFVRMADPLDS